MRKTLTCSKCGEPRWYVIDLHHRDQSEKIMDVCEMIHLNYSKERIEEEIAKCDPLCANCHREVHFLENNANVA